ncbi:hypothetical protein E3N88_34438 [Mikania micrantha]|uniref:Uncharacterized protein n=1 Tax=Mikania micrantha TaxID=192012 RepID=A0A5N6LYA2_9ASTR|nr:hypothetical protein E3N88_34438 [Mikania micrantha]
MGTNDFLENYYTLPNRRSQYNINQYQDYLVNIAEWLIKSLYGLGARKISLEGLPPMGCLPLERTTSFMTRNGGTCNNDYNKMAMTFNGKLSDLVQRLNNKLWGSKIVFSNPYPIFEHIAIRPYENKDPAHYSFASQESKKDSSLFLHLENRLF